MENTKKIILETLEKGFATHNERVDIVKSCEDLDTEEIEEIKEDLQKIDDLPFEPVVKIEDEVEEDDEEEEAMSVLSRAQRRAKAREINLK